MKRQWNAVSTWAVSVVAASGFIAGCGVGGNGGNQNTTPTTAPGAGKVTTITYWYTWQGSESKDMQKIVDEFNKTHKDIHVNALGSQTSQKELTAMTGGNPPDVAYTGFTDIPKWASVGALTDLSAYVKRDMNPKNVVQPVWKLGQYQNTQYAIPYTMDTYMLFYNKDLLQKAGISHPPKTISEMKADAWKLTKLGPSGYAQVGYLSDFPWLDSMNWRDVFGAKFYDPATKKVTVDGPQSIAALDFERSFFEPPYNKGKIKKFESGFGKYMSPNNAFFQGQLAMDVDGEWYPTFIKLYAPNLNYGVAPLPYPDGHPELANAGSVQPGMLFIPQNSQHKDAAWTFINWLLSDKPYVEFCGDKGSLPTTFSALKNPYLLKLDPGLAPFVTYAQGKNIQGFPSVSFINEYFTALGTEDQKALNLEETSQQAMANVIKQIRPLADKG